MESWCNWKADAVITVFACWRFTSTKKCICSSQIKRFYLKNEAPNVALKVQADCTEQCLCFISWVLLRDTELQCAWQTRKSCHGVMIFSFYTNQMVQLEKKQCSFPQDLTVYMKLFLQEKMHEVARKCTVSFPILQFEGKIFHVPGLLIGGFHRISSPCTCRISADLELLLPHLALTACGLDVPLSAYQHVCGGGQAIKVTKGFFETAQTSRDDVCRDHHYFSQTTAQKEAQLCIRNSI